MLKNKVSVSFPALGVRTAQPRSGWVGKNVYFLLAFLVFISPWVLPRLAHLPSLALTLAFSLVYFLPGFILTRLIFPKDRWWPEMLALAFGLSFVMCLIFIIAMVELHLGMHTAVWVWVIGLAIGMLVLAGREKEAPIERMEKEEGILCVSGLVLLGFILGACYFIGGTYGNLGGEEGYHVIFTRKIFANENLNPRNLFYLPGISSTYLYLPYHFSLALMAKLSGLDPMSCFIKFRPFSAFMTLLVMSAFVKRLVDSKLAGWTALNLLCVLVITNHAGYHSPYFAQLIPVSHHSDFSLGLGLALGSYFFWRAIHSEKRFGMEFWAGLLVAGAVLICHVREGVQLLFYSGILFGVLLVFRFREKKLIWHTLAFALFLFLMLKGYQLLQSVRVSHLTGWEEAEKAVAWSGLKTLVKNILRGDLFAFFGPRIDQVSSYMPNYDVFFRSVYGLALLITPLVLIQAKRLWALFIPVLIAVVLLMTRLPLISYGLILGGYSQILYTPARFIFHWELLMLCAAVYWVGARFMQAWGRSHGIVIILMLLAALGSGGYLIPKATSWLQEFLLEHPDAIVIYVLILIQAGLIWKFRNFLSRSKEGEQRSFGSRPCHSGLHSIFTLVLVLPMLGWSYPPSLVQQLAEASLKPSGLNVQEWCEKKDLLNLPKETMEAIRKLPSGKILAYDPRYIFNLPVVLNHYIFTFGFYFSSEKEFFDRTYRIRDRKPPFKEYDLSMYRYVDVYMNDLMLRFPLYNWLDPLEVTLRDIQQNKIDTVIASPEFGDLWSAYADYFPEVFRAVHEQGGYAVYEVNQSNVDSAVQSVLQDPKFWLIRDLEKGFTGRVLMSLSRWKSRIAKNDYEKITRIFLAKLPKELQDEIPEGTLSRKLEWLADQTCFIPAQKHYDSHLDFKRPRPVFLPKSIPYFVEVKSNGKPVDRYKLPGGEFHLLEISQEGRGEIQDIRIVEDLQKAAVPIYLPKRK